jgi:hypothetical protein
MRFVACLAGILAIGGARVGRADEGERVVVDGGLVMGLPAALPTGLAVGVGAGVQTAGPLAWGVRASWSAASESTLTWDVRHDDLRLRLTGAVQHDVGRGTLALRLGVGGNWVHETRTREQGDRAGLTGDELRTTAWSLLPAADVEVAVVVRVIGDFALAVSGGPSIDLLDGTPHVGWIGSLGVAWHD